MNELSGVNPWVWAGIALVLGVGSGLWVLRRLAAGNYRYPDEREFPVPWRGWIAPVAGLIWAGLAFVLHDRPATLLVLLALSIPLLVLAGIDQDVHRLPDRIQKPLMVVLPVALLLPAFVEGDWTGYLRALVGSAIGFGAYFLLAFFGRGSFGWGDVKLAVILGMACAWISWHALLYGLMAGFFLGALWGVWLIVARGASRKDFIPMGPFLIVGAMGTIIALAPLA